MTIEEKARAYDEALDRMKYVVIVPKDEKALQALKETIFPELRESEDERMIRKIKSFLSAYDAYYFRNDEWREIEVWLEKQKELFESGRGLYYYDGEKTTYCGYPATEENPYDFAMNQQEKQKEQKLNQSEEEREYVKTLKGLVSDFIRDSGGAISDVTYYQRICDWLDKRHIEQKPAEYLDKDKVYAVMKKLHKLAFSQLIPINSDEYKKIDEITHDIRNFLNYPIEQKPLEKQDYSGLTDLERAIHWGFLSAGVENVPVTIIKDTAKECLAQINPIVAVDTEQLLKILPQKSAWSEEDEMAFGDLMWCIEQARKSAKDENDMGNIWFAENWVKNKLKSLRPSWKPSEEQMRGLKFFLDFHRPQRNAGTTNWREYDAVESLYEQIRKL